MIRRLKKNMPDHINAMNWHPTHRAWHSRDKANLLESISSRNYGDQIRWNPDRLSWVPSREAPWYHKSLSVRSIIIIYLLYGIKSSEKNKNASIFRASISRQSH